MKKLKSLNSVEKGDILLIEYPDSKDATTILFVEKVFHKGMTSISGLMLTSELKPVFGSRSFPTVSNQEFLFGKLSIKKLKKKVDDVFFQEFNSKERIYSLNRVSKHDIVSFKNPSDKLDGVFLIRDISIKQDRCYLEGILINFLGEETIKEYNVGLPLICDYSKLFNGIEIWSRTTVASLYDSLF